MKLINPSRLLALGLLVIAVFAGCKKRGDYEVPCRILKITEKYQFDPTYPLEITTATFDYTTWGDPKSIIYNTTSTGKPNHFFTYDKHRLVALETQYTPGHTDNYTRYFYNNDGFIAYDTTYYGGGTISNPATFYLIFVNEYFYDPKGRISKTIQHISGSSNYYTATYTYDANGNLVKAGITYDNKVNFLRTSLVFAFINHNYSMNNEAIALSYNSKGVPTAFSSDWRNVHSPTFLNQYTHEIEYSCDQNHYD